jgi:hypothetical protein
MMYPLVILEIPMNNSESAIGGGELNQVFKLSKRILHGFCK